MSGDFPPGTVDCETVPPPQLRYSFCSLVNDASLYGEMVASFRDRGFTDDICEFLYADNTGENRFDAYRGLNHMIARARAETLILCHQDLLAFDAIEVLDEKLARLTELDSDWGLAGNAGFCEERSQMVQCISDIGGYERRTDVLPAPVVSLDENFIIMRRSVRVGPSVDLQGFHMYGADMVTQAAVSGRKSYVIEFHVEHRGHALTGPSFVSSARAFEEKYARAFRRRRVITTVAKTVVGGTWIDRQYRHLKRKRRFDNPDEYFERGIKLRRLHMFVHERLNGMVYKLQGYPFEIPRDSVYAMKKALQKGDYEHTERDMIARHLPADLDVVELGGSIGIVSHFIRRKIGADRRHVIVEANGRREPMLRRNSRVPGVSGETVIDIAAIWYGDEPTVGFRADPNIPSNSVVADEPGPDTVSVPAKTLGQILAENGVTGPYSLLCDIGGAEYDLLESDRAALKNCACIIVEIHPASFHATGRTIQGWLQLFREAGFDLVEEDRNVIFGSKQTEPAN